ncbi:MAG TPA: TIGR03088 family PEP-CTERM/XrtA system glycosyltransferase [Casimicrobiaceae bacterium]|nr:TIGR03088 family PEP-CTERM/XrtA system glycosyltransferase [Casimicrobiaceae bacterium]
MSARTPPLIAHVIHRLAVGGLENGLVNLINRLPAERFRHAIVCMTDATDFARRIARPDVRIVELHKTPGHSLAIQRQFIDVFRELQPAIVHSRNLGALEAQLAAALARVPIRIHGEHGWDVSDPDGTSWRYALLRRLHAPLVHRFIALSGHIERYLHERVGIRSDRIDRICNGVDCDRFRPDVASRARFPHEPFRDPNLVVVGTVGRLEPIKDQLNLAQAFVLARQRHPEVAQQLRLAIVGSGSLRSDIEQVIAGGRAAAMTWLAGERGDVADLLPAFDIFALPSRAEGISNTILEAMACGVPVVATDVGGNAELVAVAQSGDLVPPRNPAALADSIARLARDKALRMRMGAAARASAVTQFSLDEMVRRYALVYDGELKRRPDLAVAPAMTAQEATVE